MSATIRIPTPLRGFAGGQNEVAVTGATVDEALAELTGRHPQLRRHLFAENGDLRNFVNLYLNEEDVRYLEEGRTAVAEGDTITIVPSIAGGSTSASGSGSGSAARGTNAGSGLPDGGIGTREPESDSGTGSGISEAGSVPRAADPDPDPEAGADVQLSQQEILRYSRHLIMPEVGMAGQRKLKAAKVLLVGTGGLGSPLGLYLAAAGVGTLGVIDFDVVDETNLQRQVLYGTSDVGRPKLEAAADRLRGVNPHIEIVPHPVRLTSENALDILEPYDIVVDGTDNFPTRYLVNDACVLLGKPNVYGSIFRFEGQVSVFHAQEGPCYRCLFREPPPPGLVPSCAEGGVLGVLPGIIGSHQALETIKLIIGQGQPLIGRLLLFDALAHRWRELKIRKNPDCPVCGERPTVTRLIDYEAFCGVGQTVAAAASEPEGIPELTPTALKERLDRGDSLTIVDVREPHEWDIANLEPYGARLLPLGELGEWVRELDPQDEIVLHCRSGARSARALRQLRAAGFTRLWNLNGGILAWSDEVDPALPKY